MKKRTVITAVVLAARIAGAAPTAVTNRLTRVLSGSDGDQQTLASTNWTDGCVAHAGADYLIDLGDTFRLPDNTPLTFRGNSLQLGTDKVRASVAAKRAELTFENDGLFLRNVRWDHWYGGVCQIVHGRVTVLTPQKTPALFTCGNNANAELAFTGPWFAEAASGVWLSTAVPMAKGYTLRLVGDLSGFAGRFRVTSGAILELGGTEVPGEILLERNGTDGLGAGTLALVDADAQVRVGQLTLGDGATLACKVAYVPRTGGCVHNVLRVTRQLSVTGRTTISVPHKVVCFATTVRRRFPFLVRTASATGSLREEDFTLAEAVDGVSLEVTTDATTGDQALSLVLEPRAQTSPRISYEDFGAVGDGRTDDLAAIVAAHREANAMRLPVRARDDAVYYIGGAATTAPIQTDVDWGRARFIIDDTNVSNRSAAVFQVAPSVSARTLEGPASIRRNQRNLGVKVGRPSVVVATNAQKKQFIREGSNQNDGESQTEVYLVDAEGVVDASVPMTWDFDAVTSFTIVPVDADRLTVKGGVFTTIANQAESAYTYYGRGLSIRRSNVRIEGLRHEVTAELVE